MNAACAAMGGVILLLILGVQVLDWRWLAALGAAGIVAGFGILRRRAPSRYAIAQLVDRNLVLHDSVSTAFFYSRVAPAQGSAQMRTAQLADADRLAREAEIDRAVPFSTPRSVYVMALLGLIATGLLGLRYGLTRSLDLHSPLTAMLMNALNREPQPKQDQQADQKRYQELISRLGLTQENNASERKAAGSKDAATSAAEQQNEQRKLDADSKQQAGGSAQAENMRQKRDQSGADGAQNSEQQRERTSGAQQSAMNSSREQAGAAQQHESNSLVDKMRDAVSSLMSRFNAQPQQGQSQQASNSQSRSQDGSQRNGEADSQQQNSQRAERQGSGKSGAESQGQKQQGDANQMAQSGGSRSKGEDSADASKQPGSGIGSRDGNKEIREAEQLAAMGKISEIIGRRSQNLTGDATIEVASSGTQNLRTGYSQQNATHTDSGGEILRDEIPIAYQRYVQRYFEQVRKQAAPAKK